MKPIRQLEREELERSTGLTNRTLEELRYVFYSARSGITSLSINDHIRAYLKRITSSSNDSLSDLWRSFYGVVGITSRLSLDDMSRDFYTNKNFYLLNDNFTTNRAAGAINGTQAELTGGTRVITDTTNILSVAGGELIQGAQSISSTDPRYSASEPISRQAGRIFITRLLRLSSTGGSSTNPGFGVFSNPASTYTSNDNGFYFTAGSLGIMRGSTLISVFPAVSDQYYKLIVVLRSSGAYHFIDGQLVWIEAFNTSASLYAVITNISGSRMGWKSDYVRVPSDLWLPTPLASDSFSGLFGVTDGLGHAETTGIGSGGASQSFVPNISITPTSPSPTLGSEISINGDFENTFVAGLAPSWLKATAPVIPSEENVIVHGGSKSQKFVGTVSNDGIFQYVPTTAGNWYQVSIWTNKEAAGNLLVIAATNGGATAARSVTYTATGWNQTLTTFRATGSTSGAYVLQSGATVVTAYMDNASYKQLTLSSLLSQPTTYSSTNYVAACTTTLTAGTQAGIAVQVDNPANPTNGVFAYHDGTNLVIAKLVNGTWTQLGTSVLAYSVGAQLLVKKIGTTYQVFYNGTFNYSGTIADASITSGTYHCLFSTFASNTFGAFNISDYNTWYISGGKLLNFPNLGSNLVVNGTFAADTDWTKGTGWTIAAGVATATAATSLLTATVPPLTVGVWYRSTFTVSGYVGGSFQLVVGAVGNVLRSANGTYTETQRATATSLNVNALTSATGSVDGVTAAPLTLSELFTDITHSTANVLVTSEIIFTAGYQIGHVLNLDSASNPQNFVLVYLLNGNIRTEKCVAGTWTTLATTAITYSASAKLVVRKSGTAYRIYYGNTLVGSQLTISDAGIINNTMHGLFNTSNFNSHDNFTVYASGDEDQYSSLNQY